MKTALVNDDELGTRPIEVTVIRGVVRLSGRVRSQAEVDRAVALAQSVWGVTDVRVALQVGGDVSPALPPPAPAEGSDLEALEPQAAPGLLAVGAAVGWSGPRADVLRSRTTIGPLVRLGAGDGLGVAIGFDWFKADFATADRAASVARVHVRPVMVGLSYTLRSGPVAVSPGIVAGISFNSLSITDAGDAPGPLAVEAGNSLAWRPGISVWADAGARWALNLSAGYVMTGLDLTVLERGQLSTRRVRGDTLTLRGGIAYKLF